MSEYIKNLNPAQRAAVENYQGASLIIAGAGSGKTRVLTCRIAYMLEKGIEPHAILSLTFTNKAAAEMRERIGALVGTQRSRSIWMGTFHSIFARILRAEADKLGYPSTFTIYDTSDAKNVIKTIVKEKGLNDETYKPGDMMSRISLSKNNLVTPAAYEANASYIGEDREKRRPEFVHIYKEYARKCKENGAMDFDDLLLNINILFRDFPQVLAKYQQMFSYVLVDEYQDTNYAQYIIIRRLVQLHSNVCVVGDDAQSIYSFRGAKIENILRFKNDFPKAQIFKLEQNYRSTRTIVEAANSVIAKNSKQLKKECFSEGEMGDSIKVLKAYTDQEEASIVTDEIRERVRASGLDWSEVAMLYRTNAQSRVLEEYLRRRNIPYKIYGGMSFYQRKEIKDLLAYISLVINPRNDEAFKRIINYPARGIGDVTVAKIAAASQSRGISMWEAADLLRTEQVDELQGAAGRKVAEFAQLISSLSLLREQLGIYEFGLEVATQSGILSTYKTAQTPESMSALDNIDELLNSMQSYVQERESEMSDMGEELASEDDTTVRPNPPSIEEWYQNAALLTDADKDKPEDKNKVTLMTVHAAKGLEFSFVFITGLEENLFPNMMGMSSTDGIEEERRLFYVALTRAKIAAVLSFSESRFKYGKTEFCRPSRFLSEIDPQYLDVQFALDDTRTEEDQQKNPRSQQHSSQQQSPQQHASQQSGRPVYGRSNDRPAGTYNNKYSSNRTSASKPQTVPMPETQVGNGTRFKSVGTRPSATNEDAPRPQAKNYAVGMRVDHNKFGVGSIVEIEEISGDTKLIIEFTEHGRKTLLGKYAKLTVF